MSDEAEKSITISKSTLWKVGFVFLAVVLIASVWTGGFGLRGVSTGSTVQQQNTGATQKQAVTDLSVFTNNPDLYPSLGPANSKNTVIEFLDFQCPFCAMASGLPSWISQYQTQYGDLMGSAGKVETMAKQGKLRFIAIPMSFLGQESVYAAEAGYCANEQGKFWEMHDALFMAQTQGENNGKYNKDKLEIIAQGISGLDQSKFKSCLESDKYASAVQTAARQASTAASGTPTFFVNGKQVTPSGTAIQAALV